MVACRTLVRQAIVVVCQFRIPCPPGEQAPQPGAGSEGTPLGMIPALGVRGNTRFTAEQDARRIPCIMDLTPDLERL